MYKFLTKCDKINKLNSRTIYIQRSMSTPCWEWQGAADSNGYGQISINNEVIRCHILSYKLNFDNYDSKLNVLHKCNNTICWNPLHLYQGTQRDNANDRVLSGRDFNKSKTHCKRGHRLEGENVRITTKGGRQCVICKIEYDSKRSNGGRYSNSERRLKLLKEQY